MKLLSLHPAQCTSPQGIVDVFFRYSESQCAEGTLECGGLTPPWDFRTGLELHDGPASSNTAVLLANVGWYGEGGVKPPHSKALRASLFVYAPFCKTG
jgi:hypothetical protein